MTTHNVEVTLRIPGRWSNLCELTKSLPAGCHLTQELFLMPDGTGFEVNIREADNQFVAVFASSCRQDPTDEEKKAIEQYSVQVCLTGPGGSAEKARELMRAAEAILQAGGAGVFIDNSGVAFGATQWRELSQCNDAEAISFAFVGIIRGKTDAFTVGLHILGLPDLLMRKEDIGDDGQVIIELIQYVSTHEREVGDGHSILDTHGMRFFVSAVKDEKVAAHSPMHNPWGRLRLTSTSQICESN